MFCIGLQDVLFFHHLHVIYDYRPAKLNQTGTFPPCKEYSIISGCVPEHMTGGHMS